MGDLVRITSGDVTMMARFERERSPQTCSAFERLLPFDKHIKHVRWCGEACWVPFGDTDLGVPFEDPTIYPAPGELLWYAGDLSEREILMPYGACMFTSKVGPLPGNHFLTIIEGLEQLRPWASSTLDVGRLPVRFEMA